MAYYKPLIFFVCYLAAWVITASTTKFSDSGRETLHGILLHIKSVCVLGIALLGGLIAMSFLGRPFIQEICDVEVRCGFGYSRLVAIIISSLIFVPIWLFLCGKIAYAKREEGIRWDYAMSFNAAFVVGAVFTYVF